ncbi:MAG: hypothetical protein ACE5F9_10905 [Phycisphaerae bacterium]
MSTLTKVFVLLLTLSSIALSMLVVAAFARQEDWRQSMMDWQKTAMAAQAKERAATTSAQLQHQRDLDQHLRDLERVKKLTADKDTLLTRIDELSRSESDLNNKLASEQAQVTSLGNTLNVVNASHNRGQEFSRKLVHRNSELERRNIDLNDRVQELTANMEVAAMQVRALQQQITAMADARETAAPGLRPAIQIPGGAGIVEAGIPSVQPENAARMSAPIRGEIRDIRGTLASISVGRADGVVPGMTFLIYRRAGGKPVYLGTLRVTTVNANESAGTIEQTEGDIQPGDTARDEASFAMLR